MGNGGLSAVMAAAAVDKVVAPPTGRGRGRGRDMRGEAGEAEEAVEAEEENRLLNRRILSVRAMLDRRR